MLFRLSHAHRWLIAAAVVLAAPAVHADSVRRVAYLTTLKAADAADRRKEVEDRIDVRWPHSSRQGARIEFATYEFELLDTDPKEQPEDERRRIDRNRQIEEKNAEHIKRMLAWKPEVIFAPGADPARAAAQATAKSKETADIPIVFGCKCNPLSDGYALVASAATPERNLTGFTRYHLTSSEGGPSRRFNLHRKRIEFLKQASMKPVKRVGAIYGTPYNEAKWRYPEEAARLGVEWVPIRLTRETISGLPDILREQRVDAALVLADTFLDKHTGAIARAAGASPIPVMLPWNEADLGGWMHYGTVVDIPDKAAEYIVNLLIGRKVKDYPVDFPWQMELVVNYEVAKRHGWQFPPDFLLQVDRPAKQPKAK